MEDNAVRRGVRKMGGELEAQIRCRVKYWTLREWMRTGIIPTTKYAIRFSKASGIPVEELSGDDVSVSGPNGGQHAGGSKITAAYPVDSPFQSGGPEAPASSPVSQAA